MKVLILSARTGWHTDELCRALAARGHQPRVAPYESLVANVGSTSSVGRRANVSNDSNVSNDPNVRLRRRRRARANHPERLARTDHLPRRCAALDRGSRHPGRQLGPRDRARRSTSSTRRRCCRRPACRCPRRSSASAPTTRWTPSAACSASGGEVIIKPIFGSMGHGLVRIDDPELAWRVVRPLEQMRSVFYVQRAIDHGGRDVASLRRRRAGRRRDRANGAGGRLAHERRPRRHRASDRRVGGMVRLRDPSGAARSARTMRAWTCSSRARARRLSWK